MDLDHQAARAPAEHRLRAVLAGMLLLLGAGVAALSLLGPLALGWIEYHVDPDVENQVVGGDLVALAVVAPVCVLAGVLTARGRPSGPVLALAPTAFATYLYPQLAIGGEFVAQPGNSERFFPLFLVVFWLAGAALLTAWLSVDQSALPIPGTALRRAAGTVLVLVAIFLALGLHLRGLVDVVGGAPYGVEYTQGPTVFWLVKWMDLGIVVPLCILTALGLLRRAPWASLLGYAVIGWAALLGSAVAAMGVVMVLEDDPAASPGATAVFVVFALAFWVLAVLLLRPVARQGRPRRSAPDVPAPSAGAPPVNRISPSRSTPRSRR